MLSKIRPAYNRRNGQRGISLLEILVVLAITGVLAAVAIPNFTGANAQLSRQNIARQLKIYLDRARFDSTKRNAESVDQMAKLTLTSPTSFSTTIDLNHNGTLESSETGTTNLPSSSGVKIVGDNLIFPITITFDNHGRAKAVNGSNAEIKANFIVCGKNCTYTTANPANSNMLSISPAGTVALIGLTQTFFDHPVPVVSTVGADSKVNPMAQIGD